MTDAELAGLLREHALLEGDFVLRSGRRSSYYLDKYRFETQTRSPEGARRADRRARRASRPRTRGVSPGPSSVPSRSRRRPRSPEASPSSSSARRRRGTGPSGASRASSRQAKRSVSSRTWSRAGAPRSRRSRPSERPGSCAEQRSAWSTGRRVGPTRSRAKRSASCRFLRPRTSCRAEKTRKPAWLRAIRRCC